MLFPLSGNTKVTIPFFDKIVHGIVYFFFVVIWLLYVTKAYKEIKWAYWIVSLLLFIYGIIIEVLQGNFVANRTQDTWDIVANTAGILVGIVVFYKLKRLLFSKTEIPF
ncbi:MAG: VanZ family protein [Flavobacteriaceae bacterium]|nr:VanZ family protein [Flavobacteriaceae bacterium]